MSATDPRIDFAPLFTQPEAFLDLSKNALICVDKLKFCKKPYHSLSEKEKTCVTKKLCKIYHSHCYRIHNEEFEKRYQTSAEIGVTLKEMRKISAIQSRIPKSVEYFTRREAKKRDNEKINLSVLFENVDLIIEHLDRFKANMPVKVGRKMEKSKEKLARDLKLLIIEFFHMDIPKSSETANGKDVLTGQCAKTFVNLAVETLYVLARSIESSFERTYVQTSLRKI